MQLREKILIFRLLAETFTVVLKRTFYLKSTIISVVKPCSSEEAQHFGGTYGFNFCGININKARNWWHVITTKKTVVFIVTAVRTSKSACYTIALY
jgi:hypothetical protein